MTRCFSQAALATALLAAPAAAQITITADEYRAYEIASGSTVTTTAFTTDSNSDIPASDQDRIEALTQLQGANQTWDFTTITYPNEETTATTVYRDGDVAGLPGASNFPEATAAFEADADGAGLLYNYLVTNDDAVFSAGSYVPAQGGDPEVVVRFEPDPLQILAFPLTDGTSWSDQTTTTTSAGGATTETVNDYVYTVVGYGTLVTPAGSAETLMLEIETTATTTTTIPGIPPQTSTFVTTTYSWVTEGELGATAFFYDAGFPLPGGGTSAVFAGYTADGDGGSTSSAEDGPGALVLAVAPNPTTGASRVLVSAARAGDATVAVFDVTGREVARLHGGPLAAGDHAFGLEAGALAPGVYVVRVGLDGAAATLRLTVAR